MEVTGINEVILMLDSNYGIFPGHLNVFDENEANFEGNRLADDGYIAIELSGILNATSTHFPLFEITLLIEKVNDEQFQ